NAGICDSLIIGFNYLFCEGCDEMMNLDSDAIVRNDFVQRVQELSWVRNIKTGFHCTTKNKDGSDRHRIAEQGKIEIKQAISANFGPLSVYVGEDIKQVEYNCKSSVGGINMCFQTKHWDKIRSSIMNSAEKKLN